MYGRQCERVLTRPLHVLVYRLREHIEDKNTLPILIFPEGKYLLSTSLSVVTTEHCKALFD